MKSYFRIAISILLFAATGATAAAQVTGSGGEYEHTYASLSEAEIGLKDFDFPTLGDERIRLSEAVKGKKLILIHYFAAWCHNSNYDVVTINELYNKYRDRGFAVIGVCEYSSRSELKKFIEKHKPSYPICLEGDVRKSERSQTTHYFYRKKIDDSRLWGTPLNIMIPADEIRPDGETLANKVLIGAGELIKIEVDEFIKTRVGKR